MYSIYYYSKYFILENKQLTELESIETLDFFI